MPNPPFHLLRDSQHFDLQAWNEWRAANPQIPYYLRCSDQWESLVANAIEFTAKNPDAAEFIAVLMIDALLVSIRHIRKNNGWHERELIDWLNSEVDALVPWICDDSSRQITLYHLGYPDKGINS